MTENLIVLGSTGSVGRQALDVARHIGVKVTGLAANSNTGLLERQIREFRPEYCAVSDEKAAAELKVRTADTPVKILSGRDSAAELAYVAKGDTVLNSVSGIAGLRPTIAAIESYKNIALANKESLVTYGRYIMSEIKRRGLKIYPVDSEHCAIEQCIRGNNIHNISRLILTASGGPFFGMRNEELKKVTAKEALMHPTWSMGKRITVDSATMMNKGFEVIEASWLFGIRADRIDVIIHRESIIHSMVEYIDKAVIAQLSKPDMRLCIQYALTYPERCRTQVEKLDFSALGRITFATPDRENFPLLDLAYEAAELEGIIPASINAADEEAVGLFLKGKIGFCDISDIVIKVCRETENIVNPSLAQIEEADAAARQKVRDII